MPADALLQLLWLPAWPAEALLRLAAALALAWALDWRFGEPPNRWHPVAWLGNVLAPLGRWLPTLPPAPAFAAGALAWCLVVGGVALLAALLQAALLAAPAWLGVPLLAPPSWRVLQQQAGRTPSPNGGWPMAAMALYLGVRLHKPGVYLLNPGAPPPQAAQLQQALRRGQRAAWTAVLAAGSVLLVMAAWRSWA